MCAAWRLQCDMAVGSRVFFDMMYYPPFKVLVLGDLCSRVTVPVAESAFWWDILQVRTCLLQLPRGRSAAAFLAREDFSGGGFDFGFTFGPPSINSAEDMGSSVWLKETVAKRDFLGSTSRPQQERSSRQSKQKRYHHIRSI